MKVDVRKSVYSANDLQARKNAERLDRLGLRAINIMASPGAGKTSLILRMLAALPKTLTLGVIEADVASRLDADKVAAAGYPVTQINTDGGCHLDAAMIDRALGDLGLRGPGFLFIENVGNLICPAGFALGESRRLVVASVPEGDDKPVKYPAVFATADAIVLNKIDLLDLVEFRRESFAAGVRAVNEKAPILEVSCRLDVGIQDVVNWLTG